MEVGGFDGGAGVLRGAEPALGGEGELAGAFVEEGVDDGAAGGIVRGSGRGFCVAERGGRAARHAQGDPSVFF